MNDLYLDIQYLNKYQQLNLCAKNSYFSFLHPMELYNNSNNIKFALKIYKLTCQHNLGT
jgi:hypothetical protein